MWRLARCPLRPAALVPASVRRGWCAPARAHDARAEQTSAFLASTPAPRAPRVYSTPDALRHDVRAVVGSIIPLHTLRALGERLQPRARVKWRRYLRETERLVSRMEARLLAAVQGKPESAPTSLDAPRFDDWIDGVTALLRHSRGSPSMGAEGPEGHGLAQLWQVLPPIPHPADITFPGAFLQRVNPDEPMPIEHGGYVYDMKELVQNPSFMTAYRELLEDGYEPDDRVTRAVLTVMHSLAHSPEAEADLKEALDELDAADAERARLIIAEDELEGEVLSRLARMRHWSEVGDYVVIDFEGGTIMHDEHDLQKTKDTLRALTAQEEAEEELRILEENVHNDAVQSVLVAKEYQGRKAAPLPPSLRERLDGILATLPTSDPAARAPVINYARAAEELRDNLSRLHSLHAHGDLQTRVCREIEDLLLWQTASDNAVKDGLEHLVPRIWSLRHASARGGTEGVAGVLEGLEQDPQLREYLQTRALLPTHAHPLAELLRSHFTVERFRTMFPEPHDVPEISLNQPPEVQAALDEVEAEDRNLMDIKYGQNESYDEDAELYSELIAPALGEEDEELEQNAEPAFAKSSESVVMAQRHGLEHSSQSTDEAWPIASESHGLEHLRDSRTQAEIDPATTILQRELDMNVLRVSEIDSTRSTLETSLNVPKEERESTQVRERDDDVDSEESTLQLERELEEEGVDSSLIDMLRKSHSRARSLENFMTQGDVPQELALNHLLPPDDPLNEEDETGVRYLVSRIGVLSFSQRKLWVSELRLEQDGDRSLPGPRRPSSSTEVIDIPGPVMAALKEVRWPTKTQDIYAQRLEAHTQWSERAWGPNTFSKKAMD